MADTAALLRRREVPLPSLTPPQVIRKCLNCREPFSSTGLRNCPRCNLKASGLSKREQSGPARIGLDRSAPGEPVPVEVDEALPHIFAL